MLLEDRKSITKYLTTLDI